MDEALPRVKTSTRPTARVLVDVAQPPARIDPDRLMHERLLVHRAAGRPKAADTARAAAPSIGPGMTHRRYARLLREVCAGA